MCGVGFVRPCEGYYCIEKEARSTATAHGRAEADLLLLLVLFACCVAHRCHGLQYVSRRGPDSSARSILYCKLTAREAQATTNYCVY